MSASARSSNGLPDAGTRGGLSRRRFLAAGAAVGAGGAAALGSAAALGACGRDAAASGDGSGALQYPFRGEHQAGIVTPAQDHLHFASFDLTTESRADVVDLLRAWTAAAEQVVTGAEAGKFGAVGGQYDAPPDDTGEALDLPASGLTLTFGFGRSMFDHPQHGDRFGLRDRLPAGLVELPHFPGDDLDPSRVGGDLCVQACANDPQVAVHAVRNLARLGFGVAAVRWSQLGFGRTSSTSTAQRTPRNLFGFKDGTANLKAEDTDKLARHVWIADDDEARARWLTGGTYLVTRRINMHIETWDRTSLREQENIIGRTKGSGAPLSGGEETTPVDFAAQARGGPLVASNSHVRLSHPDQNNGIQLLRRGYNFTDGSNGLGRLEAGLFFMAFVRDPVKQYIPMQTKLSRDDAMSEYLLHTGSGLWAVPPGLRAGEEHVGAALFA